MAKGGSTSLARPVYIPAFRMLLSGLGVDALEQEQGQTLVDSAFLGFLIAELARFLPVDPAFYRNNLQASSLAPLPDADADPERHFLEAGFRVGLLPCMPASNADYYSQSNELERDAVDATDSTSTHPALAVVKIVAGWV